jgi:predicted SprT family Zn-dependent metalloprotease
MYTITQLQSLYRLYNKKFFDDTLPQARIEWSAALGTTAGDFTCSKVRIRLSIQLLSDRDADLKNVLVHEMIHVAQMSAGVHERSHGPFFSATMHKINLMETDVTIEVKHNYYQIQAFEQNSMLGRIKKLLALSDSPNENEAIAAARKAQALMAANGVKHQDLASVDEGSEMDEPLLNEVIEKGNCRLGWKFDLLCAIANVNYCTCLLSEGVGLRVLGNKTHVEICRSYYQYFCQLVDKEVIQHKGKGTVFLNRFREGMVKRIHEKLTVQFQEASRRPEISSSELSLAEQYIDETIRFVKFMYPSTATKRRSITQNREASDAGRGAGDKISTARHVTGATRRLSPA